MQSTYRLLLIEDDKAFAGSLYQALNKQQAYAKPIEIRSFSYEEYERQFTETRDSTREIIVFGGRESLNQEPDAALFKLTLAQQERTHVFVLVSSLAQQNIVQYWQPGVSGIVERNESAKSWLVLALQKLQRRQMPSSSSGRSSKSVAKPAKGVFGQLRSSMFSFFV